MANKGVIFAILLVCLFATMMSMHLAEAACVDDCLPQCLDQWSGVSDLECRRACIKGCEGMPLGGT
ncbi:hypothetical protein H6P81_017041 [Aristolochia fimbriata]|uniref:Plant thionin family protein n=1 Tax=Aristolochia fimbriata TaxID=158543 RepID=A0AAV7DX93_ARIFI|nr:hypothetical protein H6P81_017041 [Aristolochia fimbriata]